MRRRAISRPSATLLVAAALGPQRRGSACRSVQQQDRAIRAGGAPVRGQSERRADGAAIDWRTAGYQPTPASIRRAEEQAKATFAATLARAKRLDTQGNRVGCTRALAAARRMYNL